MEQVKTTGNDMDDFDDAELEELYSWIDSIPLSRPKRNIARDFADGVLVAEMIRSTCSQKGLVDLHNYTGANNTNKKEENWRLLNRKVFKKLNFELGDDVIRDVITSKPGVIEKVLMMLRIKLNRAEWELKKHPLKSKGGGGKRESDKPEADQYMVVKGNDPWGWESDFLQRDWTKGMKIGSPRGKGFGQKPDTSRGYPFLQRDPQVELITLYNIDRYLQDYKRERIEARSEYPAIPKQKIIRSIAESDAVPRILYEEKEQECLAKDETIRILEAKIHRMEHLVHLKDVRIDDLQNRVETMRPTGIRRM